MKLHRLTVRRLKANESRENVVRIIITLCALSISSCAGMGPAPEVRERTEQVVTHRVEAGETWKTMARDFYGDERRGALLARDNGRDESEPPGAGSAVRVFLTARDVKRIQGRLDAAREYNEGLDLVSGGNYAAAVPKFEEAVKLDPFFNDASFNLAVSYEKLGFHEKALTILEDLVEVSPGNPDYRYALGASLFAGGDLGGAEKAFREALAREPAHRKSLFSLAVVLEKRGKTEEAKSRFREYLALDPDGEWGDAARSRIEALERGGGGDH